MDNWRSGKGGYIIAMWVQKQILLKPQHVRQIKGCKIMTQASKDFKRFLMSSQNAGHLSTFPDFKPVT